jgi:putative addiction module killer protein
VDARPRKIVHYLTADGKDPFDLSYRSFRGTPAQKRIAVRLDRAEDGNLGDHKSVGAGVWELRIDFGEGYRVYYGEDGDVLVLLKAGPKSGQDKDIATAQEYWRDYNA